MSSYNTRIVRRSNALLGGAYGRHSGYREAMYVGGIRGLSAVTAAIVGTAMVVFFAAMSVRPIRRILDRVLPKPGTGPSKEVQEHGFFVTDTYTRTTAGLRYRLRIRAEGDPGYKATAMMLGESALTLALCRHTLPSRAGVLTPASAFGEALVDRLRAAGMTFEINRLH